MEGGLRKYLGVARKNGKEETGLKLIKNGRNLKIEIKKSNWRSNLKIVK